MASHDESDGDAVTTDLEPATTPPRRRPRRATSGTLTPSAADTSTSSTPAPADDSTKGADSPDQVSAADTPKKTPRKRATKAAKTAKKADESQASGAADGQQTDAQEDIQVPAFGVIFQPPVVTEPRRSRRASAPAQSPSEPADSPAPSGDATSDDSVNAANEDGDGGDNAPRKRRRRGGRGRKSGGGSADGQGSSREQSATEQADSAAADNDPAVAESDADDAGNEGSSRRRRRRRRSGSGADGDDPPGTVTKVRQRRTKDSVTSVKGSTRLEAKKQRRREGREAGRRRTIITEAEFLARREAVNRTMVIRGRDGRTQIGVLEDSVLVEHYVSRESTASLAGNIYLGRVQNVLPSMEAAFVDIGRGRNAVLYAGEVNWDAAGLETNEPKRIENALNSGDTVLVQVTKDPIGHKGARLTSQISLPGRFLVYVPEGSMTGISRKLPDTERARLKSILKEVLPESAGVIVRTAAEGASEEELRADVERLTRTWERIQAHAEKAKNKRASAGGAPVLLHSEPDLTVRVIRDIFNEDFDAMVVEGDHAWDQVSAYVSDVAPDLVPRLTKWTESTDMFAAYRIDEQIAKAMDRKVWLPSGGSLVIDRTEAMTVIDVNTGKFVGSGGNLEETVTKNNIEAAEEIVRQLRLRDIGGIIVIDFIDMVLEANRDLVVRRLLECLGRDRTKHQVAEVTSLGLVQMTRKRVGSGLIEVFSEPCECCHGRGLIVHADPIDRSAHEPDSHSSGGKGRRGRKGPVRTIADPPSGPTAAQIAAAAHAAAMKAADGDDVVDKDDDAVSLATDVEPTENQNPEPTENEDAVSIEDESAVSGENEAPEPMDELIATLAVDPEVSDVVIETGTTIEIDPIDNGTGDDLIVSGTPDDDLGVDGAADSDDQTA